ncbi:MAG: YbdD/YjiX family protein [Nitrosomonadales bacterium]|nr:YbdD/YjiX family protein [Nitrosomonadales bacterium]
MAKRLNNVLRALWRVIRELSGDDGYERYLAHHAAAHPGTRPLEREAWFARQQQQKWAGVKRCC